MCSTISVLKHNHLSDYSDDTDSNYAPKIVQIDGSRARTQIKIINDVKPPIITVNLQKVLILFLTKNYKTFKIAAFFQNFFVIQTSFCREYF